MHGVEGQHAGRMQQSELLDFLVRGQQVALHAIGNELQRATAGLARFHPLLLASQTLTDPAGQLGTVHRIDLDRHARPFQRREPRRFGGGKVQPRQRDQRDSVGGRPRRCARGQRPQRLAAVLAGLAGRNAQFDDLAVTEQRHRLLRLRHARPRETALDRHHVALGKALCARRLAQRIDGFQHQQVLVAVHHVQRRQALGPGLLQVAFQRIEPQLHDSRTVPTGL